MTNAPSSWVSYEYRIIHDFYARRNIVTTPAQHVHLLIPETCRYIRLYGKGDLMKQR
jgi:hypothetical protein